MNLFDFSSLVESKCFDFSSQTLFRWVRFSSKCYSFANFIDEFYLSLLKWLFWLGSFYLHNAKCSHTDLIQSEGGLIDEIALADCTSRKSLTSVIIISLLFSLHTFFFQRISFVIKENIYAVFLGLSKWLWTTMSLAETEWNGTRFLFQITFNIKPSKRGHHFTGFLRLKNGLHDAKDFGA